MAERTAGIPFRRAAVASALSSALLLAVPAGAQDPEPPPQPNRQLNLVSPLPGYGIMALSLAALVGISLMKSKRGAQD